MLENVRQLSAKKRAKWFSLEDYNNQLYGHNFILKNYVNAKLPYIIPGKLQHGWHNDSGIPGDLSKHDEKDKRKNYFVWNKRNLEKSLEYGYDNTIAIGSPFLYLPSHEYSTRNEKKTNSLLLFPAHSYEYEPFINPLKFFRTYLEQIEKEMLPLFEMITICLYWIEFKNKRIVRLFREKGINVITLGLNSNSKFLINFQRLVDKHVYISSNIFSSAIFYSLYMKKKVFIFGKFNSSEINLMKWKNRKIYNHKEFSNLYSKLLWRNFDNKSHYWIGENELGLEFKRSPDELREIFGWVPKNFIKGSLIGLKTKFETALDSIIKI